MVTCAATASSDSRLRIYDLPKTLHVPADLKERYLPGIEGETQLDDRVSVYDFGAGQVLFRRPELL